MSEAVRWVVRVAKAIWSLAVRTATALGAIALMIGVLSGTVLFFASVGPVFGWLRILLALIGLTGVTFGTVVGVALWVNRGTPSQPAVPVGPVVPPLAPPRERTEHTAGDERGETTTVETTERSRHVRVTPETVRGKADVPAVTPDTESEQRPPTPQEKHRAMAARLQPALDRMVEVRSRRLDLTGLPAYKRGKNLATDVEVIQALSFAEAVAEAGLAAEPKLLSEFRLPPDLIAGVLPTPHPDSRTEELDQMIAKVEAWINRLRQ